MNAIFQQPWWLDAVAPGHWDEATVKSGGRVIARLPYVVRGVGPLRALTMPPLTQTLGPWLAPSEASPSRALSQQIELLSALEAALPRADTFSQHFAPSMLNVMPFHWAGYRLELQYTYRLEDLSSEEQLWSGLRGNIRGDVRKARKRLTVRDDLGIDSFYAVWDENAAFYLLGGGDPELRNSGATSLLLWELIMRARAVTNVFDFEGSMIESVERFFRAFGGRQTPYLRVSRTTLRGRTALALRSGWRRLAPNSAP